MRHVTTPLALVLVALVLSGCTVAGFPGIKGMPMLAASAPEPAPKMATVVSEDETPSVLMSYANSGSSNVNGLISKYAFMYGVPETLVHRMVKKESNYNPGARNGPYYGLMQISHATAMSMGYTGNAKGLLNPDTNLRYAVKYLAGAYKVAGGNHDQAVRFYQRGYYYDAKRAGMLDAVGLR